MSDSNPCGFKYDYIGFCIAAKEPIKKTIDNVLLCYDCRHFRGVKK